MRPNVQRHPLVELLESLSPSSERVELEPDPPPPSGSSLLDELALLLDREPEGALPEPRQALLFPASVVPEGASRGEPLGRAGVEGVVRVEAEHGREGRDERAEPVEVWQRWRRGEGSRRRSGWFRRGVGFVLLFLLRRSCC